MIPLRDENPSHSFPFVTVALIIVCSLVFFYEVSLGPAAENFITRFALFPSSPTIVTMVTSMFMHGGWMHLIGNMWFLWIFGDNIEDFLGHFGFLIFYLVTGSLAGLVHVLMNAGANIPTVGASGAISGVLGAYVFLHPKIRIRTLVTLGFWWEVMNVPAIFFLGFWFIAQFLGMDPQVAYGAHIGGFVSGVAVILLFSGRRRNPPQARFEPRRNARFHF